MAIILIGGTGTGKSTVGKLIHLNTGFKVYEIGHVVKLMFYNEIIKDYNKTFENQNDAKNNAINYFFTNSKDFFIKKRLSYVSNKVKKYGSDYFLNKILETEKSDNIVIIGVRSKKEIETIKNKVKCPFFVGLKCDETKVTKRFVNREISRMEKNIAEDVFIKRRLIENSWGLEEELSKCNIILSTENQKPIDITRKIINEYKKYLKREHQKGKIICNEKRIIY